MSWIPLLATVIGAIIGLGSGLLTDQLRSRREQTDKWKIARREAYANYLSSLHDANEGMRAVSLGEHPPELTRKAAARAAFRAAGVSKAREHIILIAPEPVVSSADDAFRDLRTMRDRIGAGDTQAQYEPVLTAYGEHLHALRQAIRHDLGVSGPTPHIPI
ncbi:hypothetical protein [Actinomadura fibrosa]|uniref:Secreted protein n=1 Tax=Actinomadura fibrosa TaxID=111802 RepID=A0ABW2XTX4_9ACTN|nr:hypothetical protein [Actinomadura fibrosa]